MRTANIVISFIFIVFTCFYAFLIWKLPDRNLPNTLGASFVPWVLDGCMIFLTLLLLAGSLFSRKPQGEIQGKYSLKELGGIAGLLVLIFLYIKVMIYVGFIAASIVFLAALTLIAGARKVHEIAIFSVLTTVAIYLLFQHFFEVQLPAGLLF